jgi:sigma-54-specific transcriptional regulator
VNIEQAMAAGRFREDLYYRIKVAVVSLPPLRERPGDIGPLAQHFLETYCERLGLGKTSFAPDAVSLMSRYPWPGNIRELENVIHHALLVSIGPVVSAADLHLPRFAPEITEVERPSDLLEVALRTLLERPSPNLYQIVSDTLVRAAFEHCGGNQVQTAEMLGISRNVLRAHLARLTLIKGRQRQLLARRES